MAISIFSMVTGKTPVPDNLRIGEDCINNHGINGKTVRDRKSNVCVRCRLMSTRKWNEKKYDKSYMLDIDRKLDELRDKDGYPEV